MASADEFSIGTLPADGGALLRRLRLSALRDSPDSFGPTFEQASRELDSYWDDAAQRIAARDQELFVAWLGEEPIGLLSATRDAQGIGHLGAMWLDPTARGCGLGSRMLDRALDWLAGRGTEVVRLWVTEDNERAIDLYASRGFQRTGITRPLRDGSPLLNAEMERS